MGRIQTNIGLITGMDIGNTVDQLMKVAAQPRQNLADRTDALRQEQVAVTELSALLLSVQYVSDNLGKDDIYQQRVAISSNESLLSAAVTGQPVEGTYRFTPARTAQRHQLLSSGIASNTDPLGGGRLSFRFGPHVQRNASLELLDGGQGLARGRIRITDRSGASAEIDLSTAFSIEDVLKAINSNTTIQVTAVAQGDHLRLIDNTGQAVANLAVGEVGGGSTAASLGLAGIDTATAVADGTDLLQLTADVQLAQLNDGNGVGSHPVLPDIRYTLRDGTQGVIDLAPVLPGSSGPDREHTLGEILDRINATAPDKLRVEIAADGQRLAVHDLTQGTGTFKLEASDESTAAADLGLVGESADGVIVGRRLLGGLQSVLVSSLNGGRGLGPLGAIELTDRTGATNTVSLAGAETLEQVIDRINQAGVGIVATVNAAKNGIQLADTTGGYASNLIVASADATATAEALGIAADTGESVVNSGDLHLKVVSLNTRLEDFNGGHGVAQGRLTFVDSQGQEDFLDVNNQIETIGDLVLAINRLNVGMVAELNATGDGIRLRDTAGGGGQIEVNEGNSTTAADLHLLGGMVEQDVGGQMTQVIDGTTTYTVDLAAGDSLDDLRSKINALDGRVQATTFVDGSSNPFRLALTSEMSGKAGQMVVDTSQLGFSMQETAAARDALLVLGEVGPNQPNVLIRSSSNTFESVISGVRLQIKEASSQPVTVYVQTTSSDLVASVQTLVDNYNKFRDKLSEYTAYDPETNTKATLTGDATALRLDTELSNYFSGRFFDVGPIQSLGELGISFQDDGKLQFDSAKLKERFAQDSEAVERFFTDANAGFSKKLKDLSEQISGQGNSLLSGRSATLDRKITQNDKRVAWMDERLSAQRERMFMEFYRMELAIGKMQSSLNVIGGIQPLPPLSLGSSSSGSSNK